MDLFSSNTCMPVFRMRLIIHRYIIEISCFLIKICGQRAQPAILVKLLRSAMKKLFNWVVLNVCSCVCVWLFECKCACLLDPVCPGKTSWLQSNVCYVLGLKTVPQFIQLKLMCPFWSLLYPFLAVVWPITVFPSFKLPFSAFPSRTLRNSH